MRKLKETKGITLIALVITIIVLLILAAVSIATLTGENGILTKAKTAKEETNEATAREKIQVAVMGSFDKNGKLDINELKDNLKKEGITNFEDVNEFPLKVKVDDYEISIIENGKITVEENKNPSETEKNIVSASDIANSNDKKTYYGATVTGYTCDNGEGVNAWKIFYADNNNIYLIADDYIHYDYCPSSVNQNISIKNNNNYYLSMENVMKDYNGSEDITNIRIQNLNSRYFNYLRTNSQTSTNENMKKVAYMTDTSVWKVFAGQKAEYAIGGPTIEMLFSSYNQKYGTTYETQVTNNNGYSIRKTSDDNWSEKLDNMFNTDDNLYVSSKEAYAMWIASPSNFNNQYVMQASMNGTVDYMFYHSDFYGFRPLVCLKSGIQLQENEDGTYSIQ